MEQPLEQTPQETQSRMQSERKVELIDVREPEEFAAARIEGSRLIPMQTVPENLQQLEAMADDADLAILCHHGVRSLNVAAWLRQRGIENCFSVTGGIDRWSREIDPEIPRY